MADFHVTDLTSLREDAWSVRGLLAVGVLPFSLLLPSVDLSFQVKLLTIAVAELVWGFVWAVKSGRLILPAGSRKLVAFALRVDREGLRNYERILSSLRRTLLEANIPIDVVRVDPAVIHCRQDAERYVQKQPVEGVFWGESRYGAEDGQKKLKFQLSLTTQVVQIRRELLEGYLRDLSLLLLNKWTIDELNELKDVETLSEDFTEIVLGLVSIHLLFEGKESVAQQILELVVSLRQKQAPRTGIASAKAQRLKDLLIDLWARKAARAHSEGKHLEAIELLERVRGQLSLGGLLLLARARYRNGDLAQAIEATDEVDRQRPNCAAVLVNRAFFAALAMNHGEMVDRYEELRRLPDVAVDINLLEVHEFLWEESRHAPENFGLFFAAGMVSGSTIRARLDVIFKSSL